MIKELENLDFDQKFALILASSDFAVYGFCLDRKDYSEYKNGISKELTEERKIEMDTLELLENLGYPMNELGTYLYKNMIVKVINELRGISNKEDIYNNKNLLLQLQNAFSQFYFDIARNDLDMGVKTFHRHIEETLSKVNYSKADSILLNKIYNKLSCEIDYGEQALILALYMLGYAETEVTFSKTKPKIKKLTNMPDNY